MLRLITLLVILLSVIQGAYANKNSTPVQVVQGQVTDAESQQGLPGVVVMLSSDKAKHTITDSAGHFYLEQVPVGRQTFEAFMPGYKPGIVPEVLISAGKSAQLQIALVEKAEQLQDVSVTAKRNNIRGENEFAGASSRGFRTDEMKRYAASIGDPARMAANLPGVAGSSEMSNGIVVRGNSPKGVLYRLEGIDIPNPNHYGKLGGSGGAISMLNANAIGHSDFYTAAFPAEIGNATSGVFDLRLRNGNAVRPEHSFQIGTTGAELSTEGPLRIGNNASYMFSYRYSNPALLTRFLDLKGIVPSYQDLSFKLNIPSAAGTFTFFGIGGANNADKHPGKDSTRWNEENPNFLMHGKGSMGIAGISHQMYLKHQDYLKTTVSFSRENNMEQVDTLDPSRDYAAVAARNSRLENQNLQLNFVYHRKLDAANTIRTGFNIRHTGFLISEQRPSSEGNIETVLDERGSTQFINAFVQWKNRISDKLTLISGVHTSVFVMNGRYSVEPRISAIYQHRKHSFTMAAGLHSKPEHLSTHLLKKQPFWFGYIRPNWNLDLVRSFHSVAGYEVPLGQGIRLKAEAYYQKQYSVPVERDSVSGFSLINEENIENLALAGPLTSKGTGQNYGIDLSLEKPFSNNYYFFAAGSLFRSEYTNYAGKTYSSRFDRRFQANIVAGKEFKVRDASIAGLNVKLLCSGGLKETPIDLEKSIDKGRTVYRTGDYFTEKGPVYFRSDLSVYYRINNKKTTHSLQLDIQNVTNHQNYYYSYFNKRSGSIQQVNQLGFIPTICYKVEFR